jgi:16S rRNA (guanine1207-N2)-methyltransferase
MSYYQTDEFAATLRGQVVRVTSKPGLPDWRAITPATILLAETVEMPPDGRALLLGCGHGALGVTLARQIPGGDLGLTDTSFIALTMAEQTLRANKVTNAYLHSDITLLPAQAEAFDTVVMELPKGRKLARRWLAEAYAVLKPGGELYLAGANKQGIQPVIEDAAALLGKAVALKYKKGNRVARAVKDFQGADEPPWAKEPGIAPGTWYEFEVGVRGNSFRLRSLPGVFAYGDQLDDGTGLLLTQLNAPPGAQVLDVGCGYGIIGLLAARLGAAHVDMVDVNLWAVAAARENIAGNGISNARAFPSDAFSAVRDKQYNLIVTNPPFHTGQAVDYEVAQAFIEGARHALAPGGQLMLVANKFIRYDRLMRALFDEHVECLAETGRYHVLLATQ